MIVSQEKEKKEQNTKLQFAIAVDHRWGVFTAGADASVAWWRVSPSTTAQQHAFHRQGLDDEDDDTASASTANDLRLHLFHRIELGARSDTVRSMIVLRGDPNNNSVPILVSSEHGNQGGFQPDFFSKIALNEKKFCFAILRRFFFKISVSLYSPNIISLQS